MISVTQMPIALKRSNAEAIVSARRRRGVQAAGCASQMRLHQDYYCKFARGSLSDGASCANDAECQSGLCFGQCRRRCDATRDCIAGEMCSLLPSHSLPGDMKTPDGFDLGCVPKNGTTIAQDGYYINTVLGLKDYERAKARQVASSVLQQGPQEGSYFGHRTARSCQKRPCAQPMEPSFKNLTTGR